VTTSEIEPELQQRFSTIQARFIILLLAALAIWGVQDFVASFAIQQRMAATDLWTPDSWNEEQILAAFQQAIRTTNIQAALKHNANGFHPERRDHLMITAPTTEEAVNNRQTFVDAMRNALAARGITQLASSRDTNYAAPIPNARSKQLKNACRISAISLALFALLSTLLQWRRAHLPIAALAVILFSTVFVFTPHRFNTNPLIDGVHHWLLRLLITVPPIGLLGLISYLTFRVRKAAHWPEGSARIIQSELVSQPAREQGQTAQATDAVLVAYEFNVDGTNYRNERVSIGLGTPISPRQTLDRYPLGAQVAVYYDPKNPQDAVLEREPPFRLRTFWVVGTLLACGYLWLVVHLWKW
jgi:hypothetical protein